MADPSDKFAGELLRDFCASAKRGEGASQQLATRAIRFLRRRLTEAAIAGCHHCGEGEKGSPCWWCGLKN